MVKKKDIEKDVGKKLGVTVRSGEYKDETTGFFKKGNPGRPKGAVGINRTYITGRIDENMPLIMDALVKACINGDMQACSILMDRSMAKLKTSTYMKSPALKNIETMQDISNAMKETLNQVGDGDIPIEDGLDAVTLIEKRGVSLLQQEIDVLQRNVDELKSET